MQGETPTKINLDAVRRELGIRVPFERPLSKSLVFVALGFLVCWVALFGLLGEDVARDLFRSLGLVR